ncbi:MAG: hypothetical protein WCF03_14800, partial [Nitrososphaeraceae archaeon]
RASHPRRVLVYRDREIVVAEFADEPVVPQQLADFGVQREALGDRCASMILLFSIDEIVEKPRKWDIKFIRKFMIVFGLLRAYPKNGR